MAKFVPQAELPVSEQAAIRREKLAALQAEGRDPFLQTKFDFNADSAAIKADSEELTKRFYAIAEKLYAQAAPQDGAAQPENNGPDGAVDADFEVVDED